MLSDEQKGDLLRDAASETLRRDFEIMSDNVRRAGMSMSVDDVIAFISSYHRCFPLVSPEPHIEYPRPLI